MIGRQEGGQEHTKAEGSKEERPETSSSAFPFSLEHTRVLDMALLWHLVLTGDKFTHDKEPQIGLEIGACWPPQLSWMKT